MSAAHPAVAQALQYFQAGQLLAAEQLCRQALAGRPDDPDAMHLLGLCAAQRGQLGVAIDYLQRAIELNGNDPAFHCNLGEAYRVLRQFTPAIQSYQRAIELKPDFLEANFALGVGLGDMGRHAEALACFQRVAQLRPDSPDVLVGLGNALKEVGKIDEAIAAYRRALELRPNFAGACNNLGNALAEQGQAAEAIACYRRAIQLEPGYAGVNLSLGNVFRDQGQLHEAIGCYRRTLQLDPNFVEAYNNLGGALKELEQFDEAIACHRRVLELRPNHQRSLTLLVNELQHVCEWRGLNDLTKRVIDLALSDDAAHTGAVSPCPFTVLPIPTTAQQQLQCTQTWVNQRMHSVMELGKRINFIHKREAKPKIRLGYLSADFHGHATAYLIAELFEKHDRQRFEVRGYSIGPDDSGPMRKRLMNALDGFVDVREASYLDVAKRIHGDGVDILIDLKGYTGNSRPQVMALRPAPVQVNYLGYPATMAAPFMDYILVDDFIVPPNQQPYFTEKLVHLPGCYQVNDSRREISKNTPTRADCGLPESGCVFCCFNHSYKITPEMFDIWMDMLKEVPGSVLWLLERHRQASANLRKEAPSRGVEAGRLVFGPGLPLAEHLARHRCADLFIDTFPVCAHTTASDSLWAGCPVLTLAGETFVSRVAGSLLRAMNLPELITTTIADYKAAALRLAREPGALADLRSRLSAARTASPLFDAARFARHVEKAYATMWDIHQQGANPRPFSVAAV